MNTVTEAHRKEFAGYLSKWQALLGLNRWFIAFSNQLADKNCMAQCVFGKDDSDRLVSIRLGDNWKIPVTSETLESTAIHELLHVLLKDFKDVVAENPLNAHKHMWHEHEVVNALEILLLKLGRNVQLP